MIMASQEELKRLHVIRKVQEKVIKQVEAGEILCLSSRQIRRIVKRVEVEGDRGITPSIQGEAFQQSISRSGQRSGHRAVPGEVQRVWSDPGGGEALGEGWNGVK